MKPGTKVRIKPTYCLSKRHGQEFVVGDSKVLYGKVYYSLVGQDWLIQGVDLEEIADMTYILPM